MVYLALSVALAEGPPLWWTESGIIGASALFAKAQARDAAAYEKAQKELEKAKRASSALELADALLPADAARAAYASRVDRSLSGQFLRLQKHADLLGEDYSRIFGGAVTRALPLVAKGATVTECTQISQVEAMLGKGPHCPGTDISVQVAALVDADKVLQGQVADLLTVDWPSIKLDGEATAPVASTGTERSVDVARLAKAVYGAELQELDDAREAAIEQLSADLDGNDAVAKAAAIKSGEAVRDTWRKGVAALGAKLWPDVKKKLEKAAKRDGPKAVALCANPASLGGCGVPDVTPDVLALFDQG